MRNELRKVLIKASEYYTRWGLVTNKRSHSSYFKQRIIWYRIFNVYKIIGKLKNEPKDGHRGEICNVCVVFPHITLGSERSFLSSYLSVSIRTE